MISSKIIAHRANLSGPDEYRENRISAIEECISLGYDVEIDLRESEGQFYLGHDNIQEKINASFLEKYHIQI